MPNFIYASGPTIGDRFAPGAHPEAPGRLKRGGVRRKMRTGPGKAPWSLSKPCSRPLRRRHSERLQRLIKRRRVLAAAPLGDRAMVERRAGVEQRRWRADGLRESLNQR